MKIQIFTPEEYIGAMMDLVIKKRGEYVNMEYLDKSRVHAHVPSAALGVDHRLLRPAQEHARAAMPASTTTSTSYRADDLVKLDILVNDDAVDALAMIVHRDDAYHKGQTLVTKLKELIPRQLFTVPIQAAVGKKVISRANVKAHAQGRAGQVLRRRHHAQEETAREAEEGQEAHEDDRLVEVPQEAFMALLSLDEDE